MAIKIGDRVRFLNDVGGGEVVEQIDARTVLVRNSDGFDIPTLISEVIADVSVQDEMMGKASVRGRQGTLSDSVSQPQKASGGERAKPVREVVIKSPAEVRAKQQFPLLAPQKTGGGALYLGFSAADESDVQKGPFDIYIINETGEDAYVVLSRWQGKEIARVASLKVNRYCARLAATVPEKELFKYLLLNVQAIYFKDEAHPLREPVSEDVELKMNRFVRPGAFQSNRFLASSLMLYAVRDLRKEALLDSVDSVDIQALVQEKEAKPEENAPAQHPEEVVLDLHLEELLPQDVQMSPKDALDFQIKSFVDGMERALANHQVKRFVAIHGVGNGRLRAEVIATLKRRWPECDMQDASFKEYGFGATMVILRRKNQ